MTYAEAKNLTYETIRDFANLNGLSDKDLEMKLISACGVCDTEGNKIPNQCGELTKRLVENFKDKGEELDLQDVCDFASLSVKDFFDPKVIGSLKPSTV